MKVNCPNCGAEIEFRSPALPSRVCDNCQTIVMRSGDGVEAVGKAAVLPFDVSPIQMGTRGSFGGRGFQVVGRVRWGWTDGSWNEWLVLFDDGSDAWLAEAMGQYMLTEEKPIGDIHDENVRALMLGQEVPVGTEVTIEDNKYILSDARMATCIAAEGELPFAAPAGWTIFSADFRSTTGRLASLQREKTLSSLYVGFYVTLEELKPTNLRAIDGWPMPAFAA